VIQPGTGRRDACAARLNIERFHVPAFGEAVVAASIIAPRSDRIERCGEPSMTQRLDRCPRERGARRQCQHWHGAREQEDVFARPILP